MWSLGTLFRWHQGRNDEQGHETLRQADLRGVRFIGFKTMNWLWLVRLSIICAVSIPYDGPAKVVVDLDDGLYTTIFAIRIIVSVFVFVV